MWKKKRRKNKFIKSINPFNISVTCISILTGCLLVNILSIFQAGPVKASQLESLATSTLRIADAFDYYNSNRFSSQ
ncbi:MAG: hypothetical protein K8S27_14890 [Candidatus Omnitrophica bacterium]|nr:hypothetical protein [Candidatus Omnitrophota bacterium]